MFRTFLRRRFNSLTGRIFLFFWLAFCILLALISLLPTFDARIYSDLDDDETKLYQGEMIYMMQTNQLDKIVEDNGCDRSWDKNDFMKASEFRIFPILVNKYRTILGVCNQEFDELSEFVNQATNPLEPQKKRFDNREVVGPFFIHLEQGTNQSYLTYFIRRVEPQKEFVNLLFDNPALLIILIIIITTPLLLWLSWLLTKPVKELKKSVDEIITGGLVVNEKLEQSDIYEFKLVGRSFNQMVRALQDNTTSQQRLLSDISHELRTPLTRLQLAASLLRRRNGESNELTRIETETTRLDKMINELLILSRQQLNSHLEHSIFTVNHIWDDVISDATFEIEQRNLTFVVNNRITHPQYYSISGNVTVLASAVENLIRNAEKYANTRVELTLGFVSRNEINIIVDDDGFGVDETEYENIFKPFYRVDSARDRKTGGTGLGLAIVANAVTQHYGSVTASKSPLGGLRVEIRLPLWKN